MSLIEIIRSERGRKKLALEGFLYAHDRLCPDGREMWRCDRRMECKARIHTQGGRLIQRINEHTHGQDLEKIRQAKSYMEVIRLRPADFDSAIPPVISMDSTAQDPELTDCSWMTSFPATFSQIKQEEPSTDGAIHSAIEATVDSHSSFPGVSPVDSNGSGSGAVSSSTVEPLFSDASTDPMFTDADGFWDNVYSAGAFDELIGEIGGHLERYRRTYQSRADLRPQIAVKLSNIVRIMEISPQIMSHLQTKRLLTQAETDILQNEIRELERKALEQKRRQCEVRRKAILFQRLVHPSTSPAEEAVDGGPPAKSQKIAVEPCQSPDESVRREEAHDDVTRPVVPAEAAKNVTSVFPQPEESGISTNEFQ